LAWLFECLRLGSSVELTDERHGHIARRHPELLPDNIAMISETLADPDGVDTGRASNELIFRRWYDGFYGGKNVLVFVLRDDTPKRFWIVTARLSRIRSTRG
jgi:hypothetical protein